MGWLWSSGSTANADANTSKSSNTANTTENRQSPPTKAPEPAYSDPEIAKFMSQIQAEFGSSSSSSGSDNNNKTTPTATSEQKPYSSSSSSSWWSSTSGSGNSTSSSRTASQPQTQRQEEGPARLDPVGESILPTTMSCRQAFDLAFHCNSLGGQWTAVYREGEARSCSELWDDFWFCMRARVYTGEVKEEAIRNHYRNKELRKYGDGKPNSTDIWEPRPEKLPYDSAFSLPYRHPDISDDEWRTLQIERRRAVQRLLAEEQKAAATS
ncbi:hypothetical protein GGS20DRAFT_475496 [Poronia punctata]|nr:hypothetical protein GGS20DRAFT_475496 [Poronia punctata]